MWLFSWASEKIKDRKVDQLTKDFLRRHYEEVHELGGSDNVCNGYVRYYEDGERYLRLLAGQTPDEDAGFALRTIAGVAGINSMTKARRSLARGHDEETHNQRLKIARETYIMTQLHLQQEERTASTHGDKVYFEQEILPIYRETGDWEAAWRKYVRTETDDRRFERMKEAVARFEKVDFETFPYIESVFPS